MITIELLVDIMIKQGYFNATKPLTFTNLDYLQNQAKELEKQNIIEHSVELAKILFSNPIEKSGKTPQELVDNYFKNK